MPTPDRRFLVAGNRLIRADCVTSIDLTDVERLSVVIRHADGTDTAEGVHAIAAVMLLQPSALEGRHLKWARHAWAVHNLVGHPLMQLLAWLGFRKAALLVHDRTAPRPQTG